MDPQARQEPISPELALVDPELAARLRALPDPPVPAPRRPVVESPIGRVLVPVPAAPTAPPRPRFMRLRPALGRLAVAACVSALAAPYAVATVRTPAVGLSVLRPAAAQSPGDRSRDERRAARKTKRPPVAAASRTFAWAPVPGAGSYQVRIYRGSTQILRRTTVRPSIVVPPSWRYDGRAQRLTRGDYRWYVWPLDRHGTRAAVAVVRARLHVD